MKYKLLGHMYPKQKKKSDKNGWISVKEDLPELVDFDEELKCLMSEDVLTVRYVDEEDYYYFDTDIWTTDGWLMDGIVDGYVTHWKPIDLEPPEEYL